MGVKCLIILQRTKDGIFRAGQPVAGTLKYSIDKPTKFVSIDICLKGKGKCRWLHTDSDDHTHYSNDEVYVYTSLNLLLPGQKSLNGTYERPFELYLPTDIPTSFKNKICTIEYKVKATFVKDNFFGTSKKFDIKIPVYGCVSPCSPEPVTFVLHKDVFSLTSNNIIHVNGEIERTFLTPGENIKLRLRINNDTDVPITIKTELIEYFTYVSRNKMKRIDKETVKTTTGYSPIIKEKSVSNLTCTVPTLPSLYSIQHTKIMIGEYKVKVTAKVPFPHTNATVKVPVVIGERRDHLGAVIVECDDGNPSSSKMPEKEDDTNNDEKELTDEDFFEKHDNFMKQIRDKTFS